MEDKQLLTQCAEAWIETRSGRKFHFMDPKPEAVDIQDIAHALGNFCRYCGHTARFYSVAEHCVLMVRAAEKAGRNAQDLLTILLHDASEAYIGDMTRPLKQQIPLFKVIEDRIHFAVSKRFGLHWPHPEWLKDMDNRILHDERRQAMVKGNGVSENDWFSNTLEPLGVQLQFWDPQTAGKKFLQEFTRITSMMSAAQ